MRKRTAGAAFAVAMAAAIGILCSATASAAGWLCTYQSEVKSGINKICIYKCPTGAAAITITIASLCTISINQ